MVRNRYSRSFSAGFSLVELMVVTAIFVILTGVVLSSNSRFGNAIVLQNLAHDIALTVREAQIYGIAVRRYGAGSTSQFSNGYGVHFTKGGTTFELFSDIPNSSGTVNGRWTADETVRTITLSGGYTIFNLCVTASTVETCDQTRLDIVFKRPEPDACISSTASPMSANKCTNGLQSAKIEVLSPKGATRTITVESSGQISVQ